MFSIIIPLYNKEKNIGKTLESVLNQSFKQFEVIIVNDGSTDNSLDVVNQFADKRIKVFNTPNAGVSSARNLGISKCKYPFIALLDADDYWKPSYLQRFSAAIARFPEAEIFSCAYYRVHRGNNEYVDLGVKDNFMLGVIHNYFELTFSTKNSLITSSSVVIKKSLLNRTGLFNESLKYGEDLDLWFRLLEQSKLIFINEPLIYYNFDGQERACDRFYKKENDLVFHLSPFYNMEQTNKSFKRYLDQLRLQKLKFYYINGYYKKEVSEILNKIEKANFSLIWKLFYSSPRFLIKPLYNLFYKLKHKLVIPTQAYIFNFLNRPDGK